MRAIFREKKKADILSSIAYFCGLLIVSGLTVLTVKSVDIRDVVKNISKAYKVKFSLKTIIF